MVVSSLVLPDVARWYLAALKRILPPLRIAAAHRSSPVTPRGIPSSNQNKPEGKKNKTREEEEEEDEMSGSGGLTAVATGDSSMSRYGLMELMFQGARAVGSGVGIPGPINSLESIPGPRVVSEKRLCVCEREREVNVRGVESR